MLQLTALSEGWAYKNSPRDAYLGYLSRTDTKEIWEAFLQGTRTCKIQQVLINNVLTFQDECCMNVIYCFLSKKMGLSWVVYVSKCTPYVKSILVPECRLQEASYKTLMLSASYFQLPCFCRSFLNGKWYCWYFYTINLLNFNLGITTSSGVLPVKYLPWGYHGNIICSNLFSRLAEYLTSTEEHNHSHLHRSNP